MKHRQFCVAVLFGLCACTIELPEEPPPIEPRPCAPQDTTGAEPLALETQGIQMKVCGDGAVWIFGGVENSPVRRLSIRRDRDGLLVRGDGSAILGMSADGLDFGAVIIEDDDAPVVPTRQVSLVANLNADDEPWGPFDLDDPALTSNFATSATLIGPYGGTFRTELYFTKKDAHNWVVAAVDEAGDGTNRLLGSGALGFSADGALRVADLPPWAAPWEASPPAYWILDLGQDNGRITARASESKITALHEDSEPASEALAHVLTPRGEVATEYADGRRHTWGWVLDGLQARLLRAN